MLGKINSVHPHALFFVDMPNAYVRFFGEEGLNDEGISVSWLLPNHAFFQELTLRSEEHTSELQSLTNLVCRLLLEKKKELYSEFVHPVIYLQTVLQCNRGV